MKCPICNADVANNSQFCISCGRRISENENSNTYLTKDNTINYVPTYQQVSIENIPEQYKPISSWGYVGYTILFSIPFIGLILLIIYALSNENINRRNFARSYFCFVLLLVILIVAIGASLLEVIQEYIESIQM